MTRGRFTPRISGRIWRLLVGNRKEFSQTNRTVNAVCVITILFLAASLLNNYILGLLEPLLLNLICIALLFLVYWLSRFKKAYKSAFAIYALSCYLSLVAVFIYNGGLDGPALILFFLTFHLLIALSPKRMHTLWTVLHIATGLSLMIIGYLNSDFVHATYAEQSSRYIDMGMSYAVSLYFVYVITGNLRRNYERERNIVRRRTQQIAERSEKINEQNERLKEIAWMQSHGVRAQVATILGLCELIDINHPSDAANVKALKGIKSAAEKLDDVVRDINTKTEATKG